jgi:hypothetical protein
MCRIEATESGGDASREHEENLSCQQSPSRFMDHGASSLWISGMNNISISSKPPKSRSVNTARVNSSLAL